MNDGGNTNGNSGQGAPSPGAALRLFLAIEFAAIFGGAPLLFFFWLQPLGMPVIPVLVLVAALCAVTLLRSPSFDRRLLWNAAAVRGQLRRIVAVFAVSCVLLTCLVVFALPGLLFLLPRQHPVLWALIVLAYPALSVYPQEIIFRAFLFQRYQPILPSARLKVVASALAFGFVHIVFHNVTAIVLTTIGGLLFAATYLRSRSLAAVWLEHALYGWLIFTIGLGQYFLHGTAELAQRIVDSLCR